MQTRATTAAAPIRFEYQSVFDAPVSTLWRFYMSPGALERLTPPGSRLRVTDRGDGVAEGSVVEATVGSWPFRARWVAVHGAVRREESFVDIAAESPFPYWAHLHRFSPVSENRSRLTDTIWFLPPAWLPRRLGKLLSGVVLRWMFWWRHRVTRRALRGASARRAGSLSLAHDCSCSAVVR